MTDLPTLVDWLPPTRRTIVLDIEANPIDGDASYKAMLASGLCSVIGFEPQPEALAELNRRKGPYETYYPLVIGDGGSHTLHVCRASGMTSLLEPDESRLRLFNGFDDWGTVIERVPVETTRLDDCATGPFDLLKIDVQGAELMVFANGRQRLAEAVAVQTEVSFVPLYRDQPTLGEIDVELRSQGFVPHAMTALKRWPIAPTVFDGDPRVPGNQILEADVVYVRDFGRADVMTDEQLTQLALIAHFVYGSADLAYRCLLHLVQRSAVSPAQVSEYLRIADRDGRGPTS
ncbi:unannotated protein [freshwater metagenome]|uniref:Unannotated protein n=1 Tax=freshwater metagenome TaxID=449393 RepID=A0A6J6VIF1_9ZZZZ|nr:FkbM family methyltransferase [Actinomycetota bacterium]